MRKRLPDSRTDLSSLPLGALRKAQQTLSCAKIVSDSGSEDDGDDASGQEYDSAPEEETSGFAAGGKESAEKKKRDIEKRKNKHAYVTVISCVCLSNASPDLWK